MEDSSAATCGVTLHSAAAPAQAIGGATYPPTQLVTNRACVFRKASNVANAAQGDLTQPFCCVQSPATPGVVDLHRRRDTNATMRRGPAL